MRRIEVALGERTYPIYIGDSLLGHRELLEPHLPGNQVLVVTNDTVAPLYADTACAGFAGREVRRLVLPDGEAHKTLATFERVLDALLEARFSRDCAVAALGGGVVGDLAGFAAACYQRGVAFVQMPTTLLAQVDSSVGGKTAVNHPRGKNMIGAFHQPVCVLADTATLASLPPRELRAGVAEVIKYGLIRDVVFHDWLESNLDALLAGNGETLAFAVERSCANKAQVVAGDERETAGRALLNLGHTFAHAIETGLGYGAWLHGEAVAAGMCLAADLSTRMGWLDGASAARIRALIERAGLPTGRPAALEPARITELMGYDKKALSGRVRLVLLRAIGDAVLTESFDAQLLDETLRTQLAA
jgi:3-dehydroquinate synthase